MNRIAFTLPDVGLREVRGTAYVEGGALVLRLKDALLGMMDEDRRTIRIEPSALLSVHVKRGLGRDRLVLRPHTPELLEAVPGEHVAAVELRVRRKHRRALEALVAEFEDALYE